MSPPTKRFEYFQAIFPISSLVIPYILSFFDKKKIHIIVLTILFTINLSIATYLTVHKLKSNIFNTCLKNIASWTYVDITSTLSNKNQNLPIIILNEYKNEIEVHLSHFLAQANDYQKHLILSDINNINKINYNHFYMFVLSSQKEIFLAKIKKDSLFTLTNYQNFCLYYDIVELIKK